MNDPLTRWMQDRFRHQPLTVWWSQVLHAEDVEDRHRAFQAVCTLASPADILAHLESLLHDAHPEMRAQALRWVTNQLKHCSVEELRQRPWSELRTQIEKCLSDPDLDVQSEAVRAAVRWSPPDDQVAHTLRHLLSQPLQSATWAQLIQTCAACECQVELLRDAVIHALSTGSAEVREAAAYVLACWQHHSAPAEEALVNALEDEEPLVRESAARALGSFVWHRPETPAALQRATEDEDVDVAEAARQALAKRFPVEGPSTP
ncbi:MAG: hypothetical protein KatS3mg114_0583 [Planctomycetaceae bacterium]|nr:MAG: hypothetical protein KatS3mg114_0583 [Planctomycetaceae bacterium]